MTQRVVHFSELPIRALLVHRGADYVRCRPSPWARALMEAVRRAADCGCQSFLAGGNANSISEGRSRARQTSEHDLCEGWA